MKLEHEFLKWAYPDFDDVSLLDLLLSVGILGVVAALCVTSYSEYVFRARLTEAWLAVTPAKYDLVEQLALSGDTVEIPLVDASSAVPSVTVDDHLSGRKAVKSERLKRADESLQEREAGGGGGVSRYVSSTRIVGSAIVVSGKIEDRVYELGVYPAVADEETPRVYVWLCGRHSIPEGWLAQPPALTHNLPDRLVDRDCRRRNGT